VTPRQSVAEVTHKIGSGGRPEEEEDASLVEIRLENKLFVVI
jgi:hypothetical protein